MQILSTIMPGIVPNASVGYRKYLSIGASYFTSGKFWVDQGWNDADYNYTVNTEPTVYLVWKKQSSEVPWVTVNGVPQTVFKQTHVSNGYLRVLANALTMLAMGTSGSGVNYPFSGSIYEAMVLTGPKIKYGHQRLIEGYLAWKWGLQHLLPRSHSYRRVPPAR
jgi:hypothetical protein